MVNNFHAGLTNRFAITHQAWRKLTTEQRRKLTSMQRKPQDEKQHSLWIYARAQDILCRLAFGKLKWRKANEWNEFLFDLARVQRGNLRNTVLESAKNFLENLPENEWLTERFTHQNTIKSGLTQIDTVSRESHFSFWSDLISPVHLDLSAGIDLALTIISTYDATWLWAQIEKIKNPLVVCVIVPSRARLLKDGLAIAHSKTTPIAALGTLLFLENLQEIETSAWLRLEKLQPFTDVKLDLHAIKHHWNSARVRIDAGLNALIEELHSDTKDEILAEMLVWTVRCRNQQYDRRPGLLEHIAQEIIGKVVAQRLSEDLARLKIYVAVLERSGKRNFSVLEAVALHAEQLIANEIRRKILRNLESRLDMPLVESEESSVFSEVEIEKNYINYAASALIQFNKTDLEYPGNWFKERFALLPIHTEDRCHKDFFWRKGLERASFLLQIAARVLQFESNKTARIYVEQCIVDELVSRIPEWEWHRELGLRAPDYGQNETDAVWAVCQHLNNVDTHEVISVSRTAWVMLALLHKNFSKKLPKQMSQRLENDLPIMDNTITGHISWLLVQKKEWRY